LASALSATALAGVAFPAAAAPVNYQMDLRTQSGFGAGGVTGMLGMMMGGSGSSVSKSMDLQLTNPADIPDGYTAEHVVPEAMRIGPALPLKGERRSGGGGEGEPGGEPDGKVLIYWGCSPTVAKGQPEVIDLRSLGSQTSPEVAAMARSARAAKGGGSGKGGGESLPPRTLGWPYGDSDFKGMPVESSAVGDHLVQGNFMKQEIRYSLGRDMDFLEPMNLKAGGSDLKAAVPLNWDQLGRAKGYNLTAVGAGDDKEVVIWMADRKKSPMLPGSQNTCTIPAGIFQKAQMAMVSGEAVGPTQGFAYPPQKPGEKKPLIWTAKVRVSAHDSVMLGMQAAASGAAGDAAADSVVPGGSGVMKAIKGIFGN
jgi:hypothetical protein